MTQNEFFNILMDELKDIPESRLYEIIRYYQNYFFKNIQCGKNENEIISELDDPKLIAERILKFSTIDNQFNSESLSISNGSDSKLDLPSIHYNNKISFNADLLLKIGIVILSILILFPIIINIGSVLFNICQLCIQIIIESLNLAIGKNISHFKHVSIITNFISEFPQSALAAFSAGTIFLSLSFILIIFYVLKLICLLINNLIITLRKKKED